MYPTVVPITVIPRQQSPRPVPVSPVVQAPVVPKTKLQIEQEVASVSENVTVLRDILLSAKEEHVFLHFFVV